jgi:hypothetical protein
LTIALASAVAAGASGPAPRAVSPGSERGASIGDRCPTFSWSALEGASSYELVVYRLDDLGVEAIPVLAERIAGAASSFTPPLDRCLARATPYAWSVRAAVEDGVSSWADPILFTVAAEPPAEELAATLDLVRRHLVAEDGAPARAISPRRDEASRQPLGRGARGDGALLVPDGSRPLRQLSSGSVGDPAAKVNVAGEVRTVDSGGEPRLWGEGRAGADVYPKPLVPGTHYCFNAATGITYGLSTLMTDWGSAASACPTGTWVCKSTEIVGCNTTRPDGTLDYLNCGATGGTDLEEDEHLGWVAEASEIAVGFGLAMGEDGVSSSGATCLMLPTWCCWD